MQTLLGGNEVGAVTLSNFFNLHTGFIPLTMIILMGYHFWRIRKAGGLIVPAHKKDEPLTDTIPHLVAREFVVALVLLAFLLAISVIFDAPLRERANPYFSPNPAKAPWYFMGLQELLIHFHPFIVVVVFPLIILTGSFWLPFLKFRESSPGIWFISDRGKKAGIYTAISGSILTIAFIMISELLPDPDALLPTIPSLILTGLIPFVIVAGSLYLFMKYIKKKYSLNSAEYIQTFIILLVVSYAVLSLTGILFRGEGMKLMWPWQI
jgi:quinol-cytochrome oxidoreductase complex cytochrome b subunit